VEGATRRRLRCALVAALAAVCAAAVANAKVERVEQTGVFALLGGSPKIVSRCWTSHTTGLRATLKVRQFQLDGKPILNYDVEMEKLMHLVIVRDDFATLAHLHPDFDTTTGTFSQSFAMEPNHRYYVYADTTPHAIGQQVFRFTMASVGPVAKLQPVSSALAPSATAGPYTVAIGTTELAAAQRKAVDLTILKAGKPAHDLGTYLGAAAHVVFINTSTLGYVHVHPMVRGAANSGMSSEMNMVGRAGPFMQMTVPALPAGTYKLWVQFLGANDRLYTAPFTMLAR
jgi:hypothetical protein